MPQLIVTFADMFLLVRRSSAPKVLLPVGDMGNGRVHSASVSGVGVSEPLNRRLVKFLQGGPAGTVDVPGDAESIWPGEEVLRLSRALGYAARVDDGLLRDPMPASLNSRVELPPGRFIARPAHHQGADQVPWHFARGRGQCFDQVLTDRMEYSVTIDSASTYFLMTAEAGAPAVWTPHQLTRTGLDIRITISNTDPTADDMKTGFQQLEEYGLLYDLMTGGDGPRPLPAGTYDGFLSDAQRAAIALRRCAAIAAGGAALEDRPICGGGQGCPNPADAGDPC